ncbi:hypothetical protein ACFWBI_39050 [Streptomyces sp. NPDC059982]|uniref:hypothetical protein n=1 Tax=unclassified Streptomyces TaxID=2593676 RepID=UPI00368F267B
MSKTARLLTAAFIASALSGLAVPLASTAHAATGPGGIGWDVTPAHGSVSTAATPDNGIGWD